MSSRVSEKALYSNNKLIPINSKVNIIKEKYTIFDTSLPGQVSKDDSKFLNGTLISKEKIEDGGYSAVEKFVVKLDDTNEEITFLSSPHTYYFKKVAPPSGGKKVRRKRNSNKSKKNRRKSSRRH